MLALELSILRVAEDEGDSGLCVASQKDIML